VRASIRWDAFPWNEKHAAENRALSEQGTRMNVRLSEAARDFAGEASEARERRDRRRSTGAEMVLRSWWSIDKELVSTGWGSSAGLEHAR
jgi:hypothetical protein